MRADVMPRNTRRTRASPHPMNVPLKALGRLAVAAGKAVFILCTVLVPTYIASYFGTGSAIATFLVMLSVMVRAIWFEGSEGGTSS